MSTGTPSAETIGDRLGVDPSQLRRFVEFHPGPDVDDVLGITDSTPDELDAGDREAVGRWIDTVREKPDPEDLPGATPRLDGREFGRDRDLWWDDVYDKRGGIDGLHEAE